MVAFKSTLLLAFTTAVVNGGLIPINLGATGNGNIGATAPGAVKGAVNAGSSASGAVDGVLNAAGHVFSTATGAVRMSLLPQILSFIVGWT
ncbi:Protein CBG26962 [Caenorhabditis briggsae]|uniref:Protein CBG26962 n=1 Tax=Caenorhabditis briggsae TaxID=6238 RepID=B6IES8_CAEBR|nr:Protein CBG26962 [Caenorhabditis briggsae]CAR98408.1 Protein CBG26962 [Caenorhabditis briggsae]